MMQSKTPWSLFIIALLTSLQLLGNQGFEKRIQSLKTQDQLESFYYAYLDEFLLHPTAKNLYLLTRIDSQTWREPKTEAEHIARLHLWINEAYFRKQFGDVYTSVLVYEKALHYYDSQGIKDYDILNYCLKPLGNHCTRLGDFQRAEEIMLRSIYLTEKQGKKEETASILGNLSIVYFTQNRYPKAITLLEKALHITGISLQQKARLLSELGKNSYETGTINEAIKKYQEVIHLYQKNNLKDPLVLMKTYNGMGLSLLSQNKQDQAIAYIEKALEISLKSLPAYDREISKNYHLLAGIYVQKKAYPTALSLYQKSLQNLLPQLKVEDIIAQDITEKLYPENTFIEIFDGLAQLYLLKGKTATSLTYYNYAFAVENLLTTTYNSQISQLQRQASSKKRSEICIAIVYDLLQKFPSQSPTGQQYNAYLQQAWQYAEYSKAAVLKGELSKKYFNASFQNDSLIIKEKVLLEARAILDKKIQVDAQNMDKWTLERERLSNQLQVIKAQIKVKYPDRNELEPHFVCSDFLSKIKPQQTVIQYFIGKNDTYIFSAHATGTLQLRKINNSAYQNTMELFIRFFSENNGRDILAQLENYQSAAYSLFNQLLLPESQGSNLLLIIPDGTLNFLPFDALLSSKTQETYFEKMPFLVKKYSISYGYSLGVYLQKTIDKKNVKGVYGYFPVFPNNERQLQALPYSAQEAKSLSHYLHAQNYVENKALKETFLQNKEAQIIHIATHASAEKANAPPSIFFWDQTLYLPEIYGLQFTSHLVVLSACETGIGTLYQGEGAMSLARGFSYAGVKQLIVSLWRVNDQSTSMLMNQFYKHLADHQDIAMSLQAAKWDYLGDSKIDNLKKSPYYWAGFSHISNTTATFDIQKPKLFLKWVWVLGLVLMISISMVYTFKKFKKQL